jgi:hypothetical protein
MSLFSLPDFLASRQLPGPTGRPLYTYRCTEEELDSLQRALKAELPGAAARRRVGPLSAQAFCLWAAEWWSANHAGGPWRWEDLLAALGLEILRPGESGYGYLCEIVTAGLQEWKRPLLRTGNGRAFLITLACEGGLPLKLLMREQAGLRRYFRALLEEFRVYAAAGIPEHELAARVAGQLPRSLRQDVVYELSGRLISHVRALQAEIGGAADPVAELDRTRPDWRDELPLRVRDEVAGTLLKGLLADATAIARGGSTQVRWVRWLEGAAGEWIMRGELRLPTSLSREELGVLFGLHDDAAVPTRFELALRPDGGMVRGHALAAERRVADLPRVVLERVPGAAETICGEGAARGHALLLRSLGVQAECRAFHGASPLSDLPWIWVPVAGTARYELAGQGSASVAASHALVAVADGTKPVVEWHEGAWEVQGRLTEFGRDVYRLRGSARFVDDEDGAVYVVRTGEDHSDGGPEFVLQGRRREVGRDSTPVFVGVPELRERSDLGTTRAVAAANVWWKPDGPAHGWVPLARGCVGDGRVRYVCDGAVRYLARIKIFPAESAIRFLPGNGLAGDIEFSGFAPTAIHVLGPEGLTSCTAREGGVDRLHLESPFPLPSSVEIEIEWRDRGRLRLSLPYPARGTGFQPADGSSLPHASVLPLGRLSGVRATAMVPDRGARFHVEGTFLGDDSTALTGMALSFRVPMEPLDEGRFELDLGRVEHEARLRLSRSGDPSSKVRLFVASNDVSNLTQPLIRVTLFDLAFEPDEAAGVLRVGSRSRSSTSTGGPGVCPRGTWNLDRG